MADARVEYKRVDLPSYEARNGASLAQSFKYKFNFPSMYRRLKSTGNRSVTSERKLEAKAGSQNGADPTGSQNGAEILGKLTCAACSAMRLN